jgi:hypothetical protein
MAGQPTGPVNLRDSDSGIHVYYALPVTDGGVGVFEHVSVLPDQAGAETAITQLEAADRRRFELAAQADAALANWTAAVDGDSADSETAAAFKVAGELRVLLDALREDCLA